MFKIILGSDYSGYDNSLKKCCLETLSARREARCLNFAVKRLIRPIHGQLFTFNHHVLSQTNNHSYSEQN